MRSFAFSLDVVGIYFVMLEQVFKSLAKVWSVDYPFVCYAVILVYLFSNLINTIFLRIGQT